MSYEPLANLSPDAAHAWQRLPPDLQRLLKGLPPDKADEVLKQLVQQAEVTYRSLDAADLQTIQARTLHTRAFGFLPGDLELPAGLQGSDRYGVDICVDVCMPHLLQQHCRAQAHLYRSISLPEHWRGSRGTACGFYLGRTGPQQAGGTSLRALVPAELVSVSGMLCSRHSP